ncbi:uncharacterized protein LOC143300712 isoform X3 [Babylonia areolata]|uniref:uncharacterized protein LOC143300712 isoform X3 n=1 Tax=Babylonia areolata TaxID=304850 RepID=UPI003FD56269
MESAEKDCSILGNLFQTIVNDLRNSSPIWEDFTYKATKLHQCLKTTLVAISSFLEAFQRVADMATNAKGATKEIGSALTRLCMRHKSIETCLKALTSSILDSVVAPLQERLEDWKKVVAQLDKDHAKEYKKARQEIKKAASDTMRLQKKVKKGIPHGKNEMQSRLDVALQDVNAKYQQLEETEKHSVRTALIEERSRFCLFITCIKPFVDHEMQLLTEVTHLQEIMHSLCLQASDPSSLPEASEQVIADLKGMDPATLNLQPQVKQHPSPPSSPSSLGSRKSSMCSINSINSSSSGSSKSHSPSHTMHKRTASQPPLCTDRLTSVSSQDSGFTSQDTLFLRPATPQSLNLCQASNSDRDGADTADCDSTPTTPSAHLATTPTPSSGSSASSNSLPSVSSPVSKRDRVRPHTISAGSEKMYSRPALKPELFEPLPEKGEGVEGVEMREGHGKGRAAGGKPRSHSSSGGAHAHGRQSATINKMQPVLPPHCPRPKVKAVPPPALPPGAQPVYANTMDLQRMAMENQARQQQQQHQHQQEARDGEATPTSRQSTQPPSADSQQPSSADPAVSALNLEEAIRSLDSVTAALVTDVPEEEAAATMAAEREAEEKKEQEEIEMRRSSRSHKMQQNSLELAAAIRELEESTAALQSTYDSASHTSLQCSSGYATMNSTPSGSEDTIASGDLELTSVSSESEKYFTLPRRGGEVMSAALREALFPRRPASTAGVPASGANALRSKTLGSTAKPPPPVRRTASISSSPSSGPPPLQPSSQRQHSDSGQYPGSNGRGGGGGVVPSEGAYAELQLIQQSIQQKKKGPQPAPPPKPGQLQRQHSSESAHHPHMSSPSPDRASISSGSSSGSGHYAVPSVAPPSPSSTSVIQSLNAKFASLNQQYQDPHYQPLPANGGGGGGGRGGTYVGSSQDGDPGAANLMPPPSSAPAGQPKGQGQAPPPPTSGPPPRPVPGTQGQRASDSTPPTGHPHPRQGHAGNLHAQMQQQGEAEDFPLPPTAEELAEMETMYARPPPVTPKPKIQGDLMMELKRRMSAEEASDV